MDARQGPATTSSELTASADHVELAFLVQPGGGTVEIKIDGKSHGRFSTRGGEQAPGFHTFDVTRGPHLLELKTAGDGPVRMFGMRLEDDAVGTTWDALGMNGAKAPALLASEPAHLALQLAHVAPALVVLAYGTNEAGDPGDTPEEHERALRALAELTKRAAPQASCLLLGPPDRGAPTLAKLGPMIAAQRRAADAVGCAFYDQLAAMGGPGTIARWSRETPPRARRDHVHMTRAGYAELAELFVRDLVAAYVESGAARRPAAFATRAR